MPGGSDAAVEHRNDHPVDHTACFYQDDEQLIARVRRYALEGFENGERVVVVATPDHRHQVAEALRRAGIDLDAARIAGHYLELDAVATLAEITPDHELDPALALQAVGGLIGEGTTTEPMRAFGEMVALLWDSADVAGAIELESMWDTLAHEHRFAVLCAYRMSSIAERDDLAGLSRICGQHAHIDGPSGYAPLLADEATTASTAADRAAVGRTFLPIPTAIGASRHLVISTLASWDVDAGTIDDAALITSELATNAMLHARSPFRILLERHPSRLRISVFDASDTLPVSRAPEHTLAGSIDGGRGIALVEMLTTSWSAERLDHGDGKVVWGELALT